MIEIPFSNKERLPLYNTGEKFEIIKNNIATNKIIESPVMNEFKLFFTK